MITNNKKSIIIATLFFIFGFFFQNTFFATRMSAPKGVEEKDIELFWDVWKLMEEKYPFNEPTNSEKIYKAIKGLVYSYGDDYSDFLQAERTKIFQDTIEGKFGGAGIEIGIRGGFLTVIAPLKNSPAEKAGFLPGDIITHVMGNDISDQSIDSITSQIRGEVGTELTMTVLRKGVAGIFDLSLVRDIVEIPVLDTEIVDGAFIISLYNFNSGSEESFKQALKEFVKSPTEYLIINVQNNPGGYLTSSIDISSYFLDQGQIVVIEDFGDSGKEQVVHRSKGYKLLEEKKYKLGVLINNGSASASEIFAGAMQDNKSAIILGEQSYGKGSMQDVIQLEQGTSLKVTIGKWLTPNKNYISHTGISPDIIISGLENDLLIKEAVKNLKKKVL
jgi:carboxyl-terminal processing protease